MKVERENAREPYHGMPTMMTIEEQVTNEAKFAHNQARKLAKREYLTKREYFAAQALAGIISRTKRLPEPDLAAAEAVMLAEALLHALNA